MYLFITSAEEPQMEGGGGGGGGGGGLGGSLFSGLGLGGGTNTSGRSQANPFGVVVPVSSASAATSTTSSFLFQPTRGWFVPYIQVCLYRLPCSSCVLCRPANEQQSACNFSYLIWTGAW